MAKECVMKKFLFIIAICFCFISVDAFTQTSTAPQNPKEKLMESRNFEFVANTMFPLGQPPKDLVGSGYSVSFSPEMIISNMPFYGRAYGAASFKNKGMRFKGVPEVFTVENKANSFEVKLKVADGTESYTLSLNVDDGGRASLTIGNNHHGTISYQGEVVAITE